MSPIAGPTCSVCGDALPQATSEVLDLCGACREELPPYKRAVAYGAYDGELRELIHLLKYNQVHPAASVVGEMLAKAIPKLEITGAVLVVPVPLHSSKRRQRGFNQAELIARRALNCLSNSHFRLISALERVKPTASQIGLTRPQRQENLRGAFKVPHLSRVRDKNVLLVDDVMTTGTTAAECARVLRRAGATNVWVAAVARTLKNNVVLDSEVRLEEAGAVNH